jgi:hypothetical protein
MMRASLALKGDDRSKENGSCGKKIEDVAGDELKAGDCILASS